VDSATFKSEYVERLIHKGFNTVNVENWNSYVQHNKTVSGHQPHQVVKRQRNQCFENHSKSADLISLRMMMEMVLKMFVCLFVCLFFSLFNHLTCLVARESSVIFSHHESFRSYVEHVRKIKTTTWKVDEMQENVRPIIQPRDYISSSDDSTNNMTDCRNSCDGSDEHYMETRGNNAD
jgi:hypothetical protein